MDSSYDIAPHDFTHLPFLYPLQMSWRDGSRVPGVAGSRPVRGRFALCMARRLPVMGLCRPYPGLFPCFPSEARAFCLTYGPCFTGWGRAPRKPPVPAHIYRISGVYSIRANRAISSLVRARSNTATPPIRPIKKLPIPFLSSTAPTVKSEPLSPIPSGK